jgi:outer membrane protein TolC
MLGIVAGAGAQGLFPPKLSIEAAVDKALAADPRTRIAESSEKLAVSAIAEARTGRKPFVQFGQNAILSNNPVFVFGSRLEQGRFRTANFALDALNDPSAMLNLRTSLTVQQPIFDQRQTRSRVSQAEIEKRRTELQTDLVRQQLRFEVVRNYLSAVLAGEMVKVGTEAVRSAEANVKKAKDMAEVGMTTDADYLAAEVEAANAGQQKLEAESNLTVTNAALNILLGERPEFRFEYSTDIIERYFPVEDRDELLRQAFANRAELKRAELAREAARSRTQSVRDQKLPQVSAFGSVGYSSPYIANGSSDYSLGVSLTWNVFDAGRKARIEQAVTAESIAGSEIESLSNQIRLEVIRAEANHKTARAKIQVSVRSIAQAEEALRIVQDRYKFGLTTFNEVLRAESALVRARHNLLTARYEYYLSYASVLLTTGRLTDVAAF